MDRTRWQIERSDADSIAYVERFRRLRESGSDIDGEARFVATLCDGPKDILDAGCGTGRVGGYLAGAGHRVTAVDLDPILVAEARTLGTVDVYLADLATMDLDCRFDIVVAAGNVMVFLAAGTEPAVLKNLHGHVRDGGLLIAGFATDREYTAAQFVADAGEAGFVVEQQFSTWDGDPWVDGADWTVMVCRTTAMKVTERASSD